MRQVARAARMREQSEGWVKRKPIEEAGEDTEHQNGDWESSTEWSEDSMIVSTQRAEGKSVMVTRAEGLLMVVVVAAWLLPLPPELLREWPVMMTEAAHTYSNFRPLPLEQMVMMMMMITMIVMIVIMMFHLLAKY